MTSVEELERAGYDTWTPEESTDVAGWTLHAAGGFTRRVNCATAAGMPDTSPASRRIIEQWLTDRGGALVVRVTPLLAHAAVETIEAEWGYRNVDETIVMTAPATAISQDAGVAFEPVDSESFFDRLNELNDREDAHAHAWRRLLGRVADRAAGVSIGELGAGIVVRSGKYAAVYSVAVSPSARRQGLASRLMSAATDWAVSNGCETMFLQVSASNEGALSLYRALGYTEAYRYSYLVPERIGG